VALASDGDPVTGHGELGRITALSEDEVVVETDEPVELRRLDVYPSEISVDRSLTALHDAILKGARRARTCCSAGASRSSGMLLTAPPTPPRPTSTTTHPRTRPSHSPSTPRTAH